MPLRLYNTLTKRVEAFTPSDPANVTFYTCGPTVYDDAHIGNFRSFLAADLLRRWIESPLCEVARADGSVHRAAAGGRGVTHVMNITDVGHMTDDAAADGGGEDKMAVAGRRIAEAKKSGKLPVDAKGGGVDPSDPYAIADFYAGRFLEDARRLGLKVAIEAQQDPSLMPRPTKMVREMIAMIEQLVANGHAYFVPHEGAGEGGRGEGGAVYFSVESFPPYGSLSGNTLEQLRAGEGGRVSESNQSQKKHPADFLLWKADPSHVMKWPSPWGEGYPGWHIECSAMARARLGDVIDLHSGGEDNIFPHHECEIAQSCGATGERTFSRMWFHPRFLFVDGAKMSKSKGTFYTPRELMAPPHSFEPAAIRLALIGTHYRSNADFSITALQAAQRTVERWRRFVESASEKNAPDHAAADRVKAAFAAAMHEDLNIAEAVAQINKWVNERGQASKEDAEVMCLFDGVLGVMSLEKPKAAETSIGVFVGVDSDPAVVAKLEERRAARAAKDFARSDAIRDELLALGYAIKDVAGGKVEVRKK